MTCFEESPHVDGRPGGVGCGWWGESAHWACLLLLNSLGTRLGEVRAYSGQHGAYKNRSSRANGRIQPAQNGAGV